MHLKQFVLIALVALTSCHPKLNPSNNIELAINLTDDQTVRMRLSSPQYWGAVSDHVKASGNYKYKAYPYGTLAIDNVGYKILNATTITINKNAGGIEVIFSDSLTAQYNAFNRDLQDVRMNTPWGRPIVYEEHKDSIINNHFYLAGLKANVINQQLPARNELILKHNLPAKLTNHLAEEELASRLYSSFSSLQIFLPEVKRRGLLQQRLLDYLPAINSVDYAGFIALGYPELLRQILILYPGENIFYTASPADFEICLNFARRYMQPKDPGFQYLMTALYIQAKKAKTPFKTASMRTIKKFARKSIYRDLHKTTAFNHRLDYLKNNPKEGNYFDAAGNGYSLNEVLDEYKNKPVILDFWASWCGPCLQNIPVNQAFLKKYPNLNIVMISCDRSNDSWEDHLASNDLSAFKHYRSNAGNKDSVRAKAIGIPMYGLVFPDQRIETMPELTETIIKDYLLFFKQAPQ